MLRSCCIFLIMLSMPLQAEESNNMALVGVSDLQGRVAYQPTLVQQGGRWIAYVGLHKGAELNPLTGKVEGNGTIIIDVTDPKQPRTLAHVPGEYDNPDKESEAQMVRVCNIANGTYMLRDGAIRTRQEMWDVSDPSHPEFMSIIVDGLRSTHKNWWECDTGIAYLVSQESTWRRRKTMIYDLSDPTRPRFIRDFGLDGQQPGATQEPAPFPIHGPIAYKDRVYFAYGSSNNGVIQIVDRDKLINGNPEPTSANLLAPQIGRLDMPRYWGGHTTYPVLAMPIKEFAKDTVGSVRDILVVASETVRDECKGPRHPVFFLDMTEPDRPFPIGSFLVPEQSGDFCRRGGRFGPHSIQESFDPLYHGKLVFVSYFNAGVRAVDMRNPFTPVEVGYYIPATTGLTKPTCHKDAERQICSTVIQTNNAEVDARGYIYAVDRAGTGMHILELTGAAREIIQ